jgi:hypothetical protein
MKLTFASMLVVALALVVAPAMAADNASFHALTQVTVDQSAPMTDTQLSQVEGQAQVCLVCVNYATISQRNSNRQGQLSFLSLVPVQNSSQSNTAGISQAINTR